MSSAEQEPPGLDGLLDRLEAVIGRLSDPSAPLERLVADYEEAGRLVEAAQGQLDAATERIGAGAGPPVRD
ncbi:MAG TPA: exodeoxyribonuclease VII small subunit [Terriglobales bacterium]|nr:exodeoxyribonuclease VII small subunit [Terriglobales bacterium]